MRVPLAFRVKRRYGNGAESWSSCCTRWATIG